MIDDIWDKYDTDGDGSIDKEEARVFVVDNFGDEMINATEFDKLFDEFD